MRPTSSSRTLRLTLAGLAFALAGFGPALPAFGQACLPSPANLVAWWSGDGHCFDIAGTNNGTPVGGVTFVAGKVGKSFSLDGSSGYVSVPGSGLSLGTGDFSIEGWEQTTATKNWNTLVSFDACAPGIFVRGDGHLHLYGAAESADAGFNDGEWHHFAVVRQSGAVAYFKDGAPAGTTTYGNAINPNTFLIGHDYDSGDLFPGLIDEVALYNRALSSGEIAAICAAGSAGKCKSLKVLAPPQNAIAYIGLSNAPMSVVASGAGELTYQWQRNGSNRVGQTLATLVLPDAQPSDGGSYTVVVTDGTGSSVTSAPPAVLTMNTLPVTITFQPTDQFAAAGNPVTLTVAAFGSPPLSYQWRKYGVVVPADTNPTLTIPTAQMADAGCYDVVVSNAANSVTSQVAIVSILGATSTLLDTTTLIDVGNTTYDGQDIVISACTVTMNGPHTLHSLSMVNGAVLTHAPAGTNQPDNRLNLTIAQNLLMDAASRIDVNGKGYHPGFSGPGAGASLVGTTWNDWAGGGGYGGNGADSSVGLAGGLPYGSITQPVDWGSDGGSCPSHAATGAAGGGAVRLAVGGILAVNGQILANGNGDSPAPGGGGDGEIGGGSGGSLWLTVGTLTGHGTVAAEGGNADTDVDGGGGGGGRIALHYGTNNFAGLISACASGISSIIGGAGTVYTRAFTQPVGAVLVDNGGNFGAMTLLTSPEPFTLTIAHGGMVYSLAPLVLGGLHVASNGLLTHLTGQTGAMVTVHGDAVIDPGGAISADGKGYATAAGPGAGTSAYWAGGGGHGGMGGNFTGTGGGAYGSLIHPNELGSGGGSDSGGDPGGTGGGAEHLIVTGTLRADGTISADGGLGYGYGAGGAGGSLWLEVGTLSGSGTIQANGGGSPESRNDNTGGGGRIAIFHGTNTFTGSMTAWPGGSGRGTDHVGGAGSVYTKGGGQAAGDVIFDNGGPMTLLTPFTCPEAVNLYVRNGAQVFPALGQPLILTSLDIGAQGRLTHLNGQKLNVTVLNQATVRSNGSINVDGQGYPVGDDPGPGAGLTGGDTGSGGGYGGAGGTDWEQKPGGGTYGSSNAPTDWGSAGGGADGGPPSMGGGVICLNVAGALAVDGIISANGGPAFFNGDQGNPAGGSVWLSTASLSGTGLIAANGGPGDTYGGGGGGGRVAIYAPNQAFAGPITADGGRGWNWGTNGTVFFGNCAANLVPAVLALSPSGTVANWVESVELTFNTAINPASFTPADVILTTPTTILPAAQLTVTPLTPQVFRISFPQQAASGVYSLQVGPNITSTLGQPMAGAYSGQFSIQWPRSISLTLGPDALHFTWATQPGLCYQLQSSADFITWTNEGGLIAGTGATMTMDLPIVPTPRRFYRMVLTQG